MGDVAVQLSLQRQGLLAEGRGLALVDLQQHQVGKVRQQMRHARVQFLAIEQRHVEQEMLAGAPAPQHLGIGAGQHAGQGQPVLPGALLQGLQLALVQTHGQAAKTRSAGVLRFLGQGQLRAVRQLFQALQPILPGRRQQWRAHRLFGPQVVGEVPVQGRQAVLLAGMDQRQVAQQDANAEHVGHQQVDVQVQAAATFGQQAQLHIEHLPAADLQAPVREVFADLLQGLGSPDAGSLAQVVDGQPGPGALGQDALAGVADKARPQHRMALAQAAQGLLQALGLQAMAVQFLVQVAADAAQGHARIAAEPVGLLQWGQGEIAVGRSAGHSLQARRREATASLDQRPPGVQGRLLDQFGEAQGHAFGGQQRRQAHDAHRVEPLLDQGGLGFKILGAVAEQPGNAFAESLG